MIDKDKDQKRPVPVGSRAKIRCTAFLRRNIRKPILWLSVVLIGGLLLPERWHMPVQGATNADWNHGSFWYHPWGKSGVHKGIDIFGPHGRPVRSAVDGIVLSVGAGARAGNSVLVLGPKWRFHYYAHMETVRVRPGQFIAAGQGLGSVGNTGNARGKPAHLHYCICSAIPHPWLVRWQPQGWKRMFFLNPHPRLASLSPG